jgi:hypothetical protein
LPSDIWLGSRWLVEATISTLATRVGRLSSESSGLALQGRTPAPSSLATSLLQAALSHLMRDSRPMSHH